MDLPLLVTSWIRSNWKLPKSGRKSQNTSLITIVTFTLTRGMRWMVTNYWYVKRRALPASPLKVIQVKRTGRYRGELVIQTMAQCWVDFEGAVDVTNLVGDSQFLYTALVLSATSVRFPFCMTPNIFTIYRCTVLSGYGPKDTSPRRATRKPG